MTDYLASHFNGWFNGFFEVFQNAVGMADIKNIPFYYLITHPRRFLSGKSNQSIDSLDDLSSKE